MCSDLRGADRSASPNLLERYKSSRPTAAEPQENSGMDLWRSAARIGQWLGSRGLEGQLVGLYLRTMVNVSLGHGLKAPKTPRFPPFKKGTSLQKDESFFSVTS
jgi:hypothetical protein